MPYLIIVIIGLSGLIAQILLLRELLVSFCGNELTLGLILASWIAIEAGGVFIIGRIIDRVKSNLNLFVALQIVFSIALPLSIYLSRTFKALLGIPFGETMGLLAIGVSAFLIILPVAFCHGALFACLCKMHKGVARIYTWETIGTLIGGIIITYIFIPYLNSFQAVFIISLINQFICLVFFRSIPKKLGRVTIFLTALFSLFFLIGGANYIQRNSINRQWQKQVVLDYQNSIYGNVTVTRNNKQTSFFYNGIPIITAPYPDITFVQEFGNLPLLFHRQPANILVIGSGAGGLINELLKHPLKAIDYAELDPLLIRMLKKYPSDLTRKELGDRRVNIINTDGRFFISRTPNRYDVVLIGLSKPQDLTTNRLFTQEFFSLVKNRLDSEGILAFCLPGSLTYLSQELKDLNACIINALKVVFSFVRIIPGDYNLCLAANSKEILNIDPQMICARLKERGIEKGMLTPSYINYRLDKRWVDWFNLSLSGSMQKVNQDLLPFAVFQALIFWNKQFSPFSAYLFGLLKHWDLKIIAIAVFVVSLVLLFIFRRRKKILVAYSIATTGFFGMLTSLVLIFSFQVFYGYLYHQIGLFIAIFMAGVALGSALMARYLESIKDRLKIFISLEFMIIIFLFLLIRSIGSFGYLLFIVLFFGSGFLVGMAFPLAARIYLSLDKKEESGKASGILYFSDLMGGCFAGIFGGVLLLPVLGVFNTCMVMVLFKLSSLLLIANFYLYFKISE